MPITPTYPGVYIEEVPSGVHTITGVATSITAFVGSAKRGPVNRAVRVLGFADFERRFGGLFRGSEMTYAVQQFFRNGGGEAWIIRVASAATAASRTLTHGGSSGADALKITALDEGSSGNDTRVIVDYDTSNPASTFNLTVIYQPPDDPSGMIVETFSNLSMNSNDPRYVNTVVAAESKLVKAERVAGIVATIAATKGKSESGALGASDLALVDATHNKFRIAANGSDPVEVTIPAAIDKTSLANFIAGANGLGSVMPGTIALTTAGGKLVFESNVAGENSMVRILPGTSNDASVRLKLGPANGGIETDASGAMRPDAQPGPGTLKGAAITEANLSARPAANKTTLKISVDGGLTRTLTLGTTASGSSANLASTLQTEIRKLDSSPGYRNLTVESVVSGADKALLISSGTIGKGSSIAVNAGATDDIASDIGLLAGSTVTPGIDLRLQGGTETAFDPANPFAAIIASRADRKGLYALEDVRLFNILCIPGVSDSGTLSEAAAYCQERRAFLIIDAPRGLTPDTMESTATGTSLPKTSYAAVYYPWLLIADPLNGGALRSVAPSGTIAGVFARTDATRGVWKAPAGTEASLVGVQAADYALTDRENGILNPRGVNCNRIFPVYGAVSWGARTLRGDDGFADEWKYVPVRRLALFIEESLFRGTQWVVFEPNDEPLWAQIRLNVGAFMQSLFLQGAFQGKSPREAYLVKCDKETTTQNDINLGVVNIVVGFAPLKPAEFVFIRIQQLAGQVQS